MEKIDVVKFRADRNWSQSKLARTIGVNQATVWRWENGQNTPRWALNMMRHLALMYPPKHAETPDAEGVSA